MTPEHVVGRFVRENTALSRTILQAARMPAISEAEFVEVRLAMANQAEALLAVVDLFGSLTDLRTAARSAAEGLCETPVGTDQHERGLLLRQELERLEGGGP